LLTSACAYLNEERKPLTQVPSILMAGHQPELVHPGVWVKNFALNGLARRHGCVPVHLVVDNDAVKSVGLHVPQVHVPLPPVEETPPHLTTIAFDRLGQDIPYEERVVQDESLFASFPDRVPRDWGFKPIFDEFWTTVRQQSRRTKLLGERLAGARREWERRWGCNNLELPVSRISQTPSFAWFACHILSDLPRFHAVYNECTHAYRHAHGIRSRNHPVPDLAKDGEWLETPFWAWGEGSTRRKRLMARPNGEQIELRAGNESWPSISLGTTNSLLRAQCAIFAWQDLERSGLKVRPRALTNTLYARLFLCDLFIHGIGGAKYDELTDEIMRQFYGIEPPEFLVLSATLFLPFPHYPANAEDCLRLAHEERDLHWNPQRHVSLDSAAAKLVLQKNAWINQQPNERADRRERFRMLRELTEHLRSFTSEHEERIRRERNCSELEVAANSVLLRRDYSFCLYPEEMLRQFCLRFLHV
jgi:hypothetical protein